MRASSYDDGTAREPASPLLVETVVLDGMWRVADDCAEHDRRYRIAWIDPPFRPPLDETTQALGICFTGDHRIVLVAWNGTECSQAGASRCVRWAVIACHLDGDLTPDRQADRAVAPHPYDRRLAKDEPHRSVRRGRRGAGTLIVGRDVTGSELSASERGPACASEAFARCGGGLLPVPVNP
jgi:hypothetical protein